MTEITKNKKLAKMLQYNGHKSTQNLH